MHILDEIVKQKKKEIKTAKVKMPLTELVRNRHLISGARPFMNAVSTGGRLNLIAEIKKKSPSKKKGFIKNFNIPDLARIYADSGARAISVLTDNKFFGGGLSNINEVRRVINLPVLRKDFIIDEYQIYESRYFGADAVLLIARLLTMEQIKSFMHLADRMAMECLVEVHDEKDLEKAIISGAKIIGINNRDLDTFKIDLNTTFNLSLKMPKKITKVSESGISSNEEIQKFRKIGINAVLIGETFLESKDIAGKVKEIMGENKI